MSQNPTRLLYKASLLHSILFVVVVVSVWWLGVMRNIRGGGLVDQGKHPAVPATDLILTLHGVLLEAHYILAPL